MARSQKTIIIIDCSEMGVISFTLLQHKRQIEKSVSYQKLDQTLLPSLVELLKKQKISWTTVKAIGLRLPSSFVTVRLALATVNTLAWVYGFKVFEIAGQKKFDSENFSLKKIKLVNFLQPHYLAGPRISKTKKKSGVQISK